MPFPTSNSHLDVPVEDPPPRGVRDDALVNLCRLAPRVVEHELGVQVMKLGGARADEVAHDSVRVRAGLQGGGGCQSITLCMGYLMKESDTDYLPFTQLYICTTVKLYNRT